MATLPILNSVSHQNSIGNLVIGNLGLLAFIVSHFVGPIQLAAQGEPEEMRSISFRILLWEDALFYEPDEFEVAFGERERGEPPPTVTSKPPPELSYFSSEEEQPRFVAPAKFLTEEMKYVGPPVLQFHQVDFAHDNQLVPVGSVFIPEESKNLLLIFLPEGDSAYRILPIDIAQTTIANGQARVFNLTRNRIACRIGSRTELLDSRSSFTLELTREVYEFQLSFALAVNSPKDSWDVVRQETKAIDPNNRLLFLIYSRSSSRPDLRILTVRL